MTTLSGTDEMFTQYSDKTFVTEALLLNYWGKVPKLISSPKTDFSIESKKENVFETESRLESSLFYKVVYVYHKL